MNRVARALITSGEERQFRGVLREIRVKGGVELASFERLAYEEILPNLNKQTSATGKLTYFNLVRERNSAGQIVGFVMIYTATVLHYSGKFLLTLEERKDFSV